MTQPNRLSAGGRIDRRKSLTFSFNGKTYSGYQGDTLASALIANGIDVIGRSYKYSRPRGILGSGAEEPNAILQVGSSPATTIPNLRATQVELYDGLVATSVSGWPDVERDMKSALGKVGGGLMPVGFYYKTFMYPESMWMTYEKYIRKAAGLGKIPQARDPDRYDKMHHHCDVMIVGGGPAGLMAARKLVGSGLRVLVADEQQEMGGCLLGSKQYIDGEAAELWLSETLDLLEDDPDITLLPRSTVFGYYDHNFLGIVERRTDHLGEYQPGARQRLHRVRAREVLLATGAIERPLVFGNNDIPGCMLASAVSTYINRYGVIPGQKLVVMTANDSGYQAALDWYDAGREVVAIVDTRSDSSGKWPERAKAAGLEIFWGHAVINVRGHKRVSAVEIARLKHNLSQISRIDACLLSCDTVASSGGWSPSLHLSCHTGSRPVWRDDIAAFVPVNPDLLYAGGIQGRYQLSEVFDDGYKAAQVVADRLQVSLISTPFLDHPEPPELPEVTDPDETAPMAIYHIPHHFPTSRAPKQFVDFQNDVTAAGIELAVREGFESIEHVKRYTALGFGTDQGKTGNINGMAIAAKALGQSIPETGTTIFRPMYTPVTFGTLAGRDAGHLFDPARFTAMHLWHLEYGAEFENVGQWKRPWYYRQGNETQQEALNRECLATRNSVGILDASTLGKIDIQGPDAREFLNRIYTNGWNQLAPGGCRYGVMCKEDGMIFDDGVTSCIDDNHFLMTTTTGGAAGVLRWLELWHQTEWPELDLYMTSMTDHWATMTIGGPNSRSVLQKLMPEADLTDAVFPYMTWQSHRIADVEARIFRISFTGELSYEVNVNANFGLYLWEQVMAAGEEFNITPYGTETMHILRAEKGFIIAGQDTDGSVTPQDMNMAWITGKKKTFSFIGRRSWQREDTSRSDRKQLVGLRCTEPDVVIPEGAQAVNDPDEPVPMAMVGHVSSSYYSAVLGHSIALGLIKGGLSRMGESVFFPLADGRVLQAEITDGVFYDPDGKRQSVISSPATQSYNPPEAPRYESALHHVKRHHAEKYHAERYHAQRHHIEIASQPNVVLHERKGLMQHVLRGGDGASEDENKAFYDGVEATLGIPLPRKPCSSIVGEKMQIWWLSPNEWLILSPEDFSVEAKLRHQLSGHFSVVDVSGGQCVIELSGLQAQAVLRKSTSYDVDTRSLPVGKCVGTLLAKAQVVLRRSGENEFELIVRRSFADYFWLWLQDASEEFGLIIE
ncbi:sarcosine oxidase subunit alpha family protein [Photobacterium chitinilyticum]|uniref:Sarcosine oxidase subunit alpha family protein n=1 Tax=Photobacterium chitinilyticum TaxID=2485123 RepID=A0A444JRZ7_9GAMM|nr:sarcosine oxidase subunit alpha family protein [Photobacterium chitinilyticum]RWX55823.1 sarcosine oxidase subunit alpha family protein [Photobacterium chitinilyticum]